MNHFKKLRKNKNNIKLHKFLFKTHGSKRIRVSCSFDDDDAVANMAL